MDSPKFKVGDRVRVVAPVMNCGYADGDEGVVRSLDGEDYYVEFLDGMPRLVFGREIELVGERAPEGREKEAGQTGLRMKEPEFDVPTEEGPEETAVSSPTQQALRFNDGKPPLSYVLYWPYAAAELAMVCKHGEAKYEKFNYKKGAPVSESIDCALRHITKFLNGEDLDTESGRHHLAHANWNIARACDEMLGPNKERFDDRYKAK